MYDIIIIGAGVTGLATGMYAGRMNMKTLILGATSGSELPIGGVITLTDTVENYPGFIHLTGGELAKKLEEHAKPINSWERLWASTAIRIVLVVVFGIHSLSPRVHE